MDTQVKDGQLYVQHQKFGKKWKKNWFVLYPASPHGIARLEFYDSPSAGGGGSGGGPGGGANEKTRKLDKKIIRLSECISILPAVMEACPKENMLAFCVETNAKTHVFAAERTASMEWVEKMCEIAFKGGSGSGSSSSAAVDPTGGTKELQMSENLIYSSREEVDEFWVNVQPTETAERCGLAGPYYLKADREALVLKDPKTKRGVLIWPYKLLRRYGRDRVMFSFEAGRRCESGPGKFTFDTKQGNEIFQLVEHAIQSQKVLAEEQGTALEPEGHASLPHIWGPAAGGAAGPRDGGGSSSRESDGDSGGSKPNSADGVLGRREGAGDAAKGAGSNKGRSLPEPPPVRGPLGPRPGAAGLVGKGTTSSSSSSSSSTSLDDPASLYSEPADSLRLPPARADVLYSDPVDLLKGQAAPGAPTPLPRLRPQGDEAPPPQGNLYSYLSNQVNQELGHKTARLVLDEGRGGGGGGGGGGGRSEGPPSSSFPPTEHIYDEPEGCARGARGTQRPLAENLYDVACPEPRGGHRRPQEDEALTSMRPRGAPGPKPPRHKPSLAPKPGHLAEPAWKEPPPPPLKPREVFLGKNVNNNNNVSASDGSILAAGAGSELYSMVSKQRAPPSPGLWFSQQTPAQRTPHPSPLRTPDLIYDNLGDI